MLRWSPCYAPNFRLCSSWALLSFCVFLFLLAIPWCSSFSLCFLPYLITRAVFPCNRPLSARWKLIYAALSSTGAPRAGPGLRTARPALLMQWASIDSGAPRAGHSAILARSAPDLQCASFLFLWFCELVYSFHVHKFSFHCFEVPTKYVTIHVRIIWISPKTSNSTR